MAMDFCPMARQALLRFKDQIARKSESPSDRWLTLLLAIPHGKTAHQARAGRRRCGWNDNPAHVSKSKVKRPTTIEQQTRSAVGSHSLEMPPSYAAAAAAPTMNSDTNHTAPRHSLTRDLYTPQPTSMTLMAALLLLEAPTSHVYLMTHAYLQNWLRWAYQQPTPANEQDRVRQALQLAAEAFDLDLQSPECVDPAPVDNTKMSVPAHPLLLRPDVQVSEMYAPGRSPRRASSISSLDRLSNGDHQSSSEGGAKIQCCAVPERFYEVRDGLFVIFFFSVIIMGAALMPLLSCIVVFFPCSCFVPYMESFVRTEYPCRFSRPWTVASLFTITKTRLLPKSRILSRGYRVPLSFVVLY